MMIKNRIFSVSILKGKKISNLYKKVNNSGFLLGSLPVLCILLFFILPLIIVLNISFSKSIFALPPYTEILAWTEKHFLQISLNLQNYYNLIIDTYYKTAFLNSITISFISTVLCSSFGYIMAYAIHTLPKRVQPILILFISLSFWTAFLIRVYSWMNILSPNGFINSALIKFGIINTPLRFLGNYYSICVGTVFCYLPFVILPVYSVLEKVDKSYIEASYDLGSSPIKTFWKIVVPLTKNGIITGAILVFATTLGEFIIPELLGGPDVITIGRVLWIEFFNNLDWPAACALSIALALLIIVPVFFLQKRTIISN